jgi:hypothetical protein
MVEDGSTMDNRVSAFLAVGVLAVAASRCGLVGPSCLARQQGGTVATVSGEVAAGQVTVHQVPYETRGSQNDVSISWTGQFTARGPRIRVYATRIECVDFVPGESLPSAGPCSNIGSFGGGVSPDARLCVVDHTCSADLADLVQTSLVIASGRGNPEVLGGSAQYKLWVVGDRDQDVRYTMTATWFYGPDC